MTAGYIRTLRSPAVIIANLCSDALQNVVGMHHCPTFVRPARLPSTSPNSVCTHCLTTLLRTSILHSYILRVSRYDRWAHSYAPLACRHQC